MHPSQRRYLILAGQSQPHCGCHQQLLGLLLTSGLGCGALPELSRWACCLLTSRCKLSKHLLSGVIGCQYCWSCAYHDPSCAQNGSADRMYIPSPGAPKTHQSCMSSAHSQLRALAWNGITAPGKPWKTAAVAAGASGACGLLLAWASSLIPPSPGSRAAAAVAAGGAG